MTSGAVDAKNEAGIAALSAGRHDDARALFEEAVSLGRSALEAKHPSLLEALYNRGTWPRDPNDVAARAADLEEVVQATRDQGDERSRTLAASASHNLAVLREEAGRDDDARELYADALRLRQELRGPDDPSLRPTIVRLAQLEHRTGRTLLAVTLYERALVLARAELGPDHPHVRALEGYKRQVTG
ncbi:MAG: tetratricopeptide repeat protein [Polyangiaceae bacterium]|nr:tetratricopeptide repeat protein [Polyangiaceae bacterium]